jgi:hypothetical protein
MLMTANTMSSGVPAGVPAGCSFRASKIPVWSPRPAMNAMGRTRGTQRPMEREPSTKMDATASGERRSGVRQASGRASGPSQRNTDMNTAPERYVAFTLEMAVNPYTIESWTLMRNAGHAVIGGGSLPRESSANAPPLSAMVRSRHHKKSRYRWLPQSCWSSTRQMPSTPVNTAPAHRVRRPTVKHTAAVHPVTINSVSSG